MALKLTDLSELGAITATGQLLVINDNNPAVIVRDSGATGNGASPWVQFQDSGGTNLGYVGYGSSGNSNLYIVSGQTTGNIILHNGGTRQTITTSHSEEAGSYRAPLFYDLDNTSYYTNPAGTSVMNDIEIDDYIYHKGDTHTYFGFTGNDAFAMVFEGTTRLSVADSADPVFSYNAHINMNNKDIDYVNQLHFGSNVRFYDEGNDHYLNFKFGDADWGGIKMIDGNGNLHGYFYADGDDSIGILDNDGSWAVQVDGDVITALKVNDVYRVKATMSGVELSGAIAIDGATTSTGNITANQFVDAQDTAFYANPAATSILRRTVGTRRNLATSEAWSETNAWNVGTQTGYFGGSFTINGDADENNIAYEIGPGSTHASGHGNRCLVWKITTNSSASGADGGWNKTITNINPNMGHMSVIYVKRVASGNGNFYHGTSSCLNINDGSANGNPYFTSGASQSLPAGVWCVSIGYLQANNDTAVTSSSSFSGIYRLDTGERIIGNTDYRMSGGTTTTQHRTFLYYSTNTDTELWLAKPGFYEINGNEPTINELLMRPEDRVDSLRADNDMRAPIFYDSNDTTYYVNPATGSVLYGTVTIHNDADSAVSIQNAGTNAVGMYAASGDELYLGSNGGSKMRIHSGGAIESYADFRAPLFYDSNNTGYYLHGDALSNLHSISFGGVLSGTVAGEAAIGRNHAYDTLELKGYGAELMIGAQNAVIHVNYRTCNNGTSNHTPTTWYWRAGSSSNWSTHHFGPVTSNGILTATTDVRAPIFYDSSDTTYYTNPAGTSNQRNIHIKQGSTLNWYRSGDAAWVYHDGRAEGSYAALYKGTNNGSAYGNYTEYWYSGDTGTYQNINQTSNRFNFSAPITAATDIKTPVFYDSNATSYYLDPNASGISLNVAGSIHSQHRKECTASISNSYVRVFAVSTDSSQLSTIVRVTGTSHGNSHVGAFTADIIVNHYQDVHIKSQCGNYTDGVIKVESDNNGQYTMSYKSSTSNAATYYFVIEGISGELSIATNPTSTASTNTTHEHKLIFGTSMSAEGGSEPNFCFASNDGNANVKLIKSGDGLQIKTGNSGQYTTEFHQGGNLYAKKLIDIDSTTFFVDPGTTGDSSIHTAGGIKTNEWLRVNTSNTGIYWHGTGHHIYPSSSSAIWLRSGHTGASEWKLTCSDETSRGSIYANSSNQIGFLDGDGNWAFRHTKDSTTEFLSNDVVKLTIASNGDCTAVGDVVAYSDIKLKKNIKTLDGSKVYDMRGVSFTRKDTEKDGSGVIAQEIQKIAPELVTKTDDTLGVSYGNITGYLIEAIKDLKAEIEELKNHKCDGCTK